MNAIVLEGAGKTYAHYEHGLDRLREAVTGRPRHHERVALHPIDLVVGRGEVVGVVGMNGAGKSTLLKLVAGTLRPSIGRVAVDGRVSALLELGTGFHPEMTGRDNVYMSGAVMGFSRREIDALYDGIVDFAGIADAMEEPVKTYSSGMFVRLAFAVATCVEPDVLIVDEALSVGDGAFARKSFDRIMGFKEAGRTILFCSHSLYQVEALCGRAVWLHEGRLRMDGPVAEVVAAYGGFLGTPAAPPDTVVEHRGAAAVPEESVAAQAVPAPAPTSAARLLGVEVEVDGAEGRLLEARTGKSDLSVTVRFASDPVLPPPSVAIALVGSDGRIVASAGTLNDGLVLDRDADGHGRASVAFPRLPLLKGSYWINAYLLCEKGIHRYDSAGMVAEIKVMQAGLEQGVVSLPHEWTQ